MVIFRIMETNTELVHLQRGGPAGGPPPINLPRSSRRRTRRRHSSRRRTRRHRRVRRRALRPRRSTSRPLRRRPRSRRRAPVGPASLSPARGAARIAAMTAILRYTAFTDDPAGGNPAGVVLDASELCDARMQEIAAELGYSETAFATAREDGSFDVRYFSPEAEVPVLRPRDDRHRRRARRARRPGPAQLPHPGRRGAGRHQRCQRRRHGDADERRPARRGGPGRRAAAGARRPALERGQSSTPRCRRGSASPAPATWSSPPRPATASAASTTTSTRSSS